MNLSLHKAALALVVFAVSVVPALAQQGQGPSLRGTVWSGGEGANHMRFFFKTDEEVVLTYAGGTVTGNYLLAGDSVPMSFRETDFRFLARVQFPLRPGSVMTGLMGGRKDGNFTVTLRK